MKFSYDGKIYSSGSLVAGPDSRALRYGDGVFETMKFSGGTIILLEEHLARLWKGMQLLQMNIPKLFTPEKAEQEIIGLVQKNKLATARIRMAVSRGDGGLYDADPGFHYSIQVWPLSPGHGELNDNGLQLCIYRDAQKMADGLANCKHSNFLPYVMASLFAKQQQCNDAIILNNHGRVCDSTIANIFIVTGEKILTPSLGEGCIAGVMRKFLLQELPLLGHAIEEAPIPVDQLLHADEIFLTNSLVNMRWVKSIENRSLASAITRQVYQSLQQAHANIIC